MAFGETLKNARTQKGLTPSEVAEATHMMVQLVEDLEREDFRRIAAPIYGRGFVKLYAELLELDVDPLIRDFMELYSGARAPAVRMRTVEGSPKPAAEPALPRASSAVPPQRQTVQPRPSVRPLSMPLPEVSRTDAVPSVMEVEEAPKDALPAPSADAPVSWERAAEAGPATVVEPEGVAYAESDEPDLFRPSSPRRKPVEVPQPTRSETPREESAKPGSAGRLKMPIFKIGGRLEKEHAPEAEEPDEASHARRLARIQKFAEGFGKLRRGVERRLTSTLPYKRYVAVGCAGLVVLVCMGFGLHTLFKLTGGPNVKESPAPLSDKVAPPPDMYVD